eukprot:407132-Lingulodinium_polyedra.AAC.1
MARPEGQTGQGGRCVSIEYLIRDGMARSATEQLFTAAGDGDRTPEYHVLVPRAAQHMAYAWLVNLQYAASANGGWLE